MVILSSVLSALRSTWKFKNRGVWVLSFLRILCCGWHCHTRPHIVLYLLWSCSGRVLSSLGFFGTRNPRLPSSAALRFFRSTVLRFSYLPFCLPCCIRFFSKVQTRGRTFLPVAARVVGFSILWFQSSRVPEFLNSLVLGFLKYGIISCYLNFARENEIRGTYRAHAKSSSSLELNFGSSVLGFLPSQIL